MPEVCIQWPEGVEGSLDDIPAAIAVAALTESAFAKSAAYSSVSCIGIFEGNQWAGDEMIWSNALSTTSARLASSSIIFVLSKSPYTRRTLACLAASLAPLSVSRTIHV